MRKALTALAYILLWTVVVVGGWWAAIQGTRWWVKGVAREVVAERQELLDSQRVQMADWVIDLERRLNDLEHGMKRPISETKRPFLE